jgi:hypothetical protein
MSKMRDFAGKGLNGKSVLTTEKIAVMSMQIDCKVFLTQLVWGIVTNGIF